MQSTMLSIVAGFSDSMLFTYLAVMIFMIVCMWKVFEKAGQPGWAVLVPIYNLYVMLQIAKKPGWWILLMLIPLVNFVIMILMYIEIAKAFGKGTGFALGLMFLGFIFWPILAFGSDKYIWGEDGNKIEDHLVG